MKRSAWLKLWSLFWICGAAFAYFQGIGGVTFFVGVAIAYLLTSEIVAAAGK